LVCADVASLVPYGARASAKRRLRWDARSVMVRPMVGRAV
jgi:hypothetical protein